MRSLAALYSYRISKRVLHMQACKNIIWMMRLVVNSPYMPFKRGIPMTRVLGIAKIEKRVMVQSRLPNFAALHRKSAAKNTTFWSESPTKNFKFIA